MQIGERLVDLPQGVETGVLLARLPTSDEGTDRVSTRAIWGLDLVACSLDEKASQCKRDRTRQVRSRGSRLPASS